MITIRGTPFAKKCAMVFLSFMVVLSTVSIMYPNTAKASDAGFRYGQFIYSADFLAAPPNALRYSVQHWYIHTEPMCTRSDRTYREGDNCTPLGSVSPQTGETNQHLALYRDVSGFVSDNDFYYEDGEEYVKTTWTWSEESVLDAIAAAGLEWVIEEGGTLYMSPAVAAVRGERTDPIIRGGPYDTLVEIVNYPYTEELDGWRNPSDIRQMYDVPITFQGNPAGYPVDMHFWTYDEEEIQPPERVGMFPAGTELLESFPETIEHNGETWEIYYSDLRSKLRGEPTWPQDLSDDDRTNDTVVTRNFTVAVGGTDMVAKYRPRQGPDCTIVPDHPDCQDDDPGGDPDPDPGGGSGSCRWRINSPSAGTRISDSVMNPNATGEIRADGVFDEERGIPTSETINLSLKAFVFASR